MPKLLIVGDVSIDLTMAVPHFPQPDEKVHCVAAEEGIGGVATNTAVAARRAGACVALAVQRGNDPMSELACAAIRAEGIELNEAVADGSICRVVTVVEPHGEKRLLLYPGISLYPQEAQIGALPLTGVSHLHTAAYGPAAWSLIARAREAGVAWSLDLEPATFPNGIDALAALIDGAAIVMVNDRAAAAIGGGAVARLGSMGAQRILRTMGADGAALQDRMGAQIARAPAPQGLPIIDTTGAGDCLAGWFLAARSLGHDEPEALTQAVRAATMACGAAGAQTAIPDRASYTNHWGKPEQ